MKKIANATFIMLMAFMMIVFFACNDDDDDNGGSGGGSDWEQLQTGADVNALNDVVFKNVDEGWVVGNDGILLLTFNGGETWENKTLGDEHLNKIFHLNDSSAWIVGDNKTILFSNDKWESHQAQSSPVTADFNDVFFISKTRGWLAGVDTEGNGLILTTSNGGQTWNLQTTPVETFGLNEIHFTDAETGFAMGELGTFLKTTDGGQTWLHMEHLTGKGINSLDFANYQDAYGVGDKGLFFYTFDEGESWEVGGEITVTELNDIFYVDDMIGWIVGSGGMIYYTLNSGYSWYVSAISTNADLRSICFVHSKLGFCVGEAKNLNGVVYRFKTE